MQDDEYYFGQFTSKSDDLKEIDMAGDPLFRDKFPFLTSHDHKYMWPYARGPFYGISGSTVIALSSMKDSLDLYSHEDAMVGSWMLGRRVKYEAVEDLWYSPYPDLNVTLRVSKGNESEVEPVHRSNGLNGKECFLTAPINSSSSSLLAFEWIPISASPLVLMYSARWDVRKRHGKKYKTGGPNSSKLYARVYLAGPLGKLSSSYAKQNLLKQISCQFGFPDDTSFPSSSASIQWPTIENWDSNLLFERIFIDCYMSKNHTTSNLPTKIKLQLKYPSPKLTAPIPIRGNSSLLLSPINDTMSLAVCVRPLTANFKSYSLVANFLVYYSTMGVSHFVLYTFDKIDSRMMGIFELAKSLNVSIELPRWGFNRWGSHEYMQTLNIEVCLHRMMGLYKYVAVVKN